MNKTLLSILLCVVAYASASAQINYTEKERLNDGWLHLRGDIGNIWEAVRPAAEGSSETVPLWSEVSLPHCFNAEDAVDPDVNYYQGAGWYKRDLAIDNPHKDGRTLLHFEGAGQKTQVYVYTEKVADHVGGYDEWTVDVTDAVERFRAQVDASRFGGKVPISIRCDNSRDAEMIPSDLSDFNLYGGVYRYLNLVYTPAIAIDAVATYASVDAKGAVGKLDVEVSFANYTSVQKGVVTVEITDPEGKVIKSEKTSVENFSGSKNILSMQVAKPKLWSPSSPSLYTCKVTLTSEYGTMSCSEKFGFRHFEFVKKGPFKLNGERLLLQGTHRHEDHAGVAAAMTEQMIVEEMEMIKRMGVNFIRLGHYQQSRIVLEQCDRLGILVWEEIPWCRGGLGGEQYQAQAKRMLTNMITQHRNHPSVILWGMGNENDWPNDFPEFDKDKIRAFMTALHNLSHQIDDTRLTAIRRCDFCKDIIDVYSPSIWAGWYRGIYTDYKKVSHNEMQQVDRFLHVEWGGDSHARRYAEDPYVNLDRITAAGRADERGGDATMYGGTARASRDGEWSESYIVDLVDWHLKEQQTMEWLTGTAYWPFKDFSTPVRPENPTPYMNQKGVVERDLTPKEAYYVFQSYWTQEPMVHIYGQNWAVRWGDAGEEKELKVFSNCEQVELFLNGVSLGVKKRNSQDFPAAGLRWNTPLREGANILRAVAKSGKTTIETEQSFEYQTTKWGAPAKVDIQVIEETSEYIWIEALLRDSNGVLCLDSREFIHFDSTGDGTLIQNQGTSSGSRKVQAYNGRARIKLLKNGGRSVISVRSNAIPTAFVEVR